MQDKILVPISSIAKECTLNRTKYSSISIEGCFSDTLPTYNQKLTELITHSFSQQVYSYNDRFIMFMTLPPNFKQEYKVPCIRDMLNIESLGLDYIILGDKDVIRIFSEKPELNVNDLVSILWGTTSYIKQANNYFSCRVDEISHILNTSDEGTPEGWKCRFKAIQDILNTYQFNQSYCQKAMVL